MATKKNTTEEAELKKGITPTSPEADEAAEQRAAATAGLGADDGFFIDYDSAYKTDGIYRGQKLELRARFRDLRAPLVYFRWTTDAGEFVDILNQPPNNITQIVTIDPTVFVATKQITKDMVTITLESKPRDADGEGGFVVEDKVSFKLRQEPDWSDLKSNLDAKLDKISESIKNSPNLNNTVPVSLQRTAIPQTDDLGLWVVIRKSTQAISFNNYFNFMNLVLCSPNTNTVYKDLLAIRALPFNDTDAYRLLKVATEAFLLTNGGVALNLDNFTFEQPDIDDLKSRISGNVTDLGGSWKRYLRSINGVDDPMLPYLALVNRKFGSETFREQVITTQSANAGDFAGNAENCLNVLRNKLTEPFLVELIWSYWHEEGMLVQSMNAIARRFQNVRSPHGSRDPLANLEIDPLRGLNNLLWGFVQDEQHRLSLVRRVYEYDHHYGITLQGKAVPKLRPADSRSKFIEAFHQLLHLCSIFFKQDDDTTVNSDGFPILNALREVHLILSQGAHNQFGDLPSTARQEMLLQQWLLARPEFREFLPTRNMVAYPEPWMDRVDAMKTLQGWTDISIDHFNRLAVFGEQILLSVRFGAWSNITQSAPAAANWARFWRAEIQGYIHDYRAVTGVDLTSTSKVDTVPPSVHLFKRYMEQARR